MIASLLYTDIKQMLILKFTKKLAIQIAQKVIIQHSNSVIHVYMW